MSNDKVEHVKAAGQTRNHTCHWLGCREQVPPAMWGCSRHWFKLPKEIRDKIWAAYNIGQETDMSLVTREYLAAAQEAEDWIRRTFIK